MKTPISRQALENTYQKSLKPFLENFSEMVAEFSDMFGVAAIPDVGIELLDSLDSTLLFHLWEFCENKSLSFEIELFIHFNQYDYEIEWYIDTCNFEKKVKLSYDEPFTEKAQISHSNATGKAIIEGIKNYFPEKE